MLIVSASFNVPQGPIYRGFKVVRKFRTTTQHGAIEGLLQTQEVKYCNLDVIIFVGYRVKSRQGTMVRIWATQRLRDYIIRRPSGTGTYFMLCCVSAFVLSQWKN